MIELIVSDLDDTLLDPSGDLPPRTRKALRAAMDAGAYVTFASGRMLESTAPFAETLGVNAPLIVYNGALVYDLSAGRAVSRASIPAETARGICRMAEKRGLYAQAYPGDGYYCREKCEYTYKYEKSIRIPARLTPNGQPLSEWIDSDQLKLLLIGAPGEESAHLEALRGAFPGGVGFFTSRPGYIEVVPDRASKAEALKALAALLGVSKKGIAAFGDGENDIAMLEYAQEGYAVANAPEAVRGRAAGVVPSNVEEGVAQAIETWLAEGRIGRE